jgi:hypothetical protein
VTSVDKAQAVTTAGTPRQTIPNPSRRSGGNIACRRQTGSEASPALLVLTRADAGAVWEAHQRERSSKLPRPERSTCYHRTDLPRSASTASAAIQREMGLWISSVGRKRPDRTPFRWACGDPPPRSRQDTRGRLRPLKFSETFWVYWMMALFRAGWRRPGEDRMSANS